MKMPKVEAKKSAKTSHMAGVQVRSGVKAGIREFGGFAGGQFGPGGLGGNIPGRSG